MTTTLNRACAFAAACVVAAILALCVPGTAWAEQDGLTAGLITQAGKAKTTEVAEEPAEEPAAVAFKKNTAKLKVDKSKGWLIDNGTYFLVLGNDSTKVLGSKAKIQTKTGAKNQAWKIKFDYNAQTYVITNAKTGKALTVNKKAKKNSKLYEAPVTKAKQHLTKLSTISSFNIPIPSQRWVLMSSKNGYYFASAVDKTMIVDLSGSRAKLVKKSKAKKMPYIWFVGKSGTYKNNGIGEGTYTLKSQSAKQFLNINKSKVKKNVKAKVNKATTLWGEMFKFEYAGKGYYKIFNFNSGMALTGKAGKVYQAPYKSKSKNYQLWKPVIVGSNGAIQLLNKKTGKALTVAGTGLTLKKADAQNAKQRWLINPTSTGLTTVGEEALHRANKYASKTKHAIVLDMTAHEYFLFRKAKASQSGAPWVLEDTSRCSTGRRNYAGKPITWAGVNETGSYPGHVDGVPAKYCIWAGHGSWIHSIVTFGPQGDNQMGWYISAGCIRLPYDKAKYVFDLKERGTRLIRYYK